MRILVAALLLVFGAGLVNAQETARSTKAAGQIPREV